MPYLWTLDPSLLVAMNERPLRIPVDRTFVVVKEDSTIIDLTAYVTKWGKCTYKAFNELPGRDDKLEVPTLRIELLDEQNTLQIGHQLSPWADMREFLRSTFQVSIWLGTPLTGHWLIFYFFGIMREPLEYSAGERFSWTLTSIFQEAMNYKWLKEDRVGGFTGYTSLDQ